MCYETEMLYMYLYWIPPSFVISVTSYKSPNGISIFGKQIVKKKKKKKKLLIACKNFVIAQKRQVQQ